jgi:hypothetical protein
VAAPGVAAPVVTAPERRHWVRATAAAVVITLGCLMAPLSVAAVWTSTQLTDTDAYVETVAPLIEEPAVQEALATAVTDEVFTRLDIQDRTTEALQAVADRTELPPLIEERLLGLAVPITDGVEGFVADQVNSLVASDEFEQAWVDANRVAHEGLVAALTGEQDGAVEIAEGGTVSVNVAPFIEVVKQRLIDRGFTVAERIPDVQASFVVLQSADLARAQTLFSVLDTLGTVFPFIVLAVLGAGVLLARNRRRALVGAGLGVAGAMVLLGVLLAVGREAYLNAVPADLLPRDAAALIFDTLVRYLRIALRSVLLLGLVIAAAAYLAGPSGFAVRTRAVARRGFATVRGWGGGDEGLAGSTVGRAVRTLRRPLQVLAVVVAGLTLVFWDRPTPAVLIAVVLVLLAFLALLEILGAAREPREVEPPGSAVETTALPSAAVEEPEAEPVPVGGAPPAAEPAPDNGQPARSD